ncbi:hypothetical protein [Vibrio sp. PNB22_4_1]
MNKVSLLAASVAIALTGCGGSDGGSNGGNSGVVITGFDGYFKNAVVFEDLNNNGQWDTNDTFLGLTDEKGQLKIKAKPESTLALQTITPNGAKQKQLIALDPTYAGTYTVDMDHPSQAMAHELVFRAPNSSNVISPITDLVAIEMANDSALTEEEAVAKVNQALGGTEEAPIDLYSDFVSGVDKSAELHKTAQILTESKAQNPANYEKKATEFAQAADLEVDRLVESGADINDPNLRPVITDSTPESENLAPETVYNNKLVVNEDVEEAAENKLDNLPEIVEGAGFDGVELNIEGLFKDDDQNLVTPKLTHNLAGTGIEVSIVGEQLILSAAAEVTKAGEFEIILTAEDKDPSGKTLATVSTVFELDIETANQAPIVIEEEQKRLQSIVDGWQLQQGEAFEQTLDISGLFKDEDGQITDYSADYVDIEGLTATESNNAIVTIKGTPTNAGESGRALAISATDGHTAVQIALSMPEVKEGATPPPVTHPLEGKFLHFVEIGGNDTDFSKAWCDSIYIDANTKTMYWNDRDNGNLSTCDTDMSEFTEGVPYKVIGDQIISQEDGMKMTLDVIKQHSFGDDEHFLVSFTDEEDGEKSTELYSYHTNAQYVEEALNNDVSESQENANWVDRETFIAMPSAEGSNDIVVTELKVSGIVQQFDYQGSPYTSASIHGRNAETCEILKDIYLDYGSIQVHGDNPEADSYFNNREPQYKDVENSCYIDLMPFDHSVEIPAGLYTIEAQPERTDEAERIVFSFKK